MDSLARRIGREAQVKSDEAGGNRCLHTQAACLNTRDYVQHGLEEYMHQGAEGCRSRQALPPTLCSTSCQRWQHSLLLHGLVRIVTSAAAWGSRALLPSDPLDTLHAHCLLTGTSLAAL